MSIFYIKKGERYDYSLKSTEERSKFVEKRLNFIWDATPDMLMGYSSDKRKQDKKYNKIPKMIDAYTAYYLSSRDAGNKGRTEYSFYLDERDVRRRKGNRMVNNMDLSMDDNEIAYEDTGLTPSFLANEKMIKDSISNSVGSSVVGGVDSDVIKYAISKGRLLKSDYKKILSNSGSVLFETNDIELSEMIEQIIFNCMMMTSDSLDVDILKLFTNGEALRGIADKLGVSPPTVKRRLDKLLSWI